MRWRNWLRLQAGSGGFYFRLRHWHNPSVRTMALGSIQPLSDMNARGISWVSRWPMHRADRQTYHIHVQILLKSGSLNLLESPGSVQARTGMPYLY
jgi:hypothetical protein